MSNKINTKQRFVRCPRCLNVLSEPTDVPVYKCGGCNATLQAKKRNNSTVSTTSHKPDDDSPGKSKVDQVFGDRIQEAGSSSNQQLLVNSIDESDQNSDHDAANIAKNGSIDAPKQKLKQLSDNHEASNSSSLNQPSVFSSIEEPHRIVHNDPRSSTELSGNEDPESSPEATGHIRIDQELKQNTKPDNTDREQLSDNKETCSSFNQQLIVDSNSINNSYHNEDPESSPDAIVDNRIDEDYNDDDSDQVFLSCRRDTDFEDSGSEFEEALANKRIVRDSECGSKSSFKSLTAKKMLDTKLKKPVRLDEDDELSEDDNADMHRRRRFNHISSIETTKTEPFGGYESSASSFNHRSGKVKHRSTDVRSYYGLNEFHQNRRHRLQMISENPKLERIELLKKVRELQDQLERTNISNHVLNNPGRFGPRMAFSGETTGVNRRLHGGTCHHCCPQDCRFSAQLPRPHVCCSGPRYTSGPYYSPRVSLPSSPIHNPLHSHTESEFSAPDDYRHRNDITKPFHSPKKKRYVRPIANGSPWITCYRCLNLLELPQSFLVFHKRFHSLRCGACMKVLNFTLSNGTHVSRYYPEETITAPPSSEVEDYIDLNGSRGGPVSCSDRSFQKSYSTETERNFWEFSEERRKATMSRDPSGSSQPSCSKVLGPRKMTSEIKVVHRPNGSPLHRLMGYASPSKVIRGSDGVKF
ncbi:uncharacterized protein LOC143533021 [Bidens hawaiensis]|uniref:uncharacterized protein LOC143533021 n=1 Tax=Bidens hawaiensis TaxID=980011 RepID=UPI00404B6AE4